MEERKFHFSQVLFPLFFVAMLWGVEIAEYFLPVNFTQFGLYPRRLENLYGIFSFPFIHDDWQHLINNSVPMVLLGIAIFYFYKEVAIKIYLYSILITGLWVWVFARPAYHIGASAMVYSFAAFVFFSGFFKKYYRLIALSLLVVFVYGSLIWGILPIDYRISWEGHLMGGLCGLLLAYFYRHYGPEPKKYDWEFEEEDDDERTDIDFENKIPNLAQNSEHNHSTTGFHSSFHYTIKKKPDANNSSSI